MTLTGTSLSWRTIVAIGVVVAPISGYIGWKLGDREKPYHRLYGLVTLEDPTMCGLPPGPIPEVILASGGQCLRQEWTVVRTKACNVIPSNPYVYRWLTDSKGRSISLPVIPSLQVDGNVPPMTKTFIGPPMSPGWVSYEADVALACPIDIPGLRGVTNPVQLLFPLHMNELSTQFRAE